jgi:hypothetical protein
MTAAAPGDASPMFYSRPKMSAIFYALGVFGLFIAVLGFFVALTMYFETRGVTKDDFKDAFVAVIATGLGSLLLLGMASILNVLHDLRAEASKIAAAQVARLGGSASPGPATPGPVPFPDRVRKI